MNKNNMKEKERLHYFFGGNMCEKQLIYYGRNLPFNTKKHMFYQILIKHFSINESRLVGNIIE